jgi:ferric-dicitrate binding protein FerR (iron transport regulator)
MNLADEPRADETGEDATVRLLRLAGARPAVPQDRTARVRATVHERWRARNRRRANIQRGLSALLLVAGVTALILIAGRFGEVDHSATPPGELVAVVEQIDGIPQRMSGPAGSARTRLSRNDAIRTGEWIATGEHARVALRFVDGTSVRLDAGSRVRPVSSTAIELSAGAVYVDSGGESGSFEIRTKLATARDIGTQFEIRLLDRAVRLRVRTGIVELMQGDRSVSGDAGTEITWTGSAAVSRPIAAYGPEWEWAARMAPPLDIEGMTLATFLERVSREQGWRLRYADPALARESSSLILHGSVDDLSPRDALDVAIATSNMRHRLEGGDLILLRK